MKKRRTSFKFCCFFNSPVPPAPAAAPRSSQSFNNSPQKAQNGQKRKCSQKHIFQNFAGDSLKNIIFNAPAQDTYSRSFLKMCIFRPRPTFFAKPSQTYPKTSPNHSQTHPKTSQNWRKSDPEMTFGEPGIEPTTSRFQVRGPTHWGILASQNCSSEGFLCIKNTESACQNSKMCTCAYFFRGQNSARPISSRPK